MQYIPELQTESCLKPIGNLAKLIEAMSNQEMAAYLLTASKPDHKRTSSEQEIIDKLSFLL